MLKTKKFPYETKFKIGRLVKMDVNCKYTGKYMDKKHTNLQSKSQTFITSHIFPVIFIERGFRAGVLNLFLAPYP